MKRLAGMLFSSWLATAVTGAGLESAAAGKSDAAMQDLDKVEASSWVRSASWTKSTDAYFLNLTLDWTGYVSKRRPPGPDTGERAAPVPSELPPAIQPPPNAPPGSAERSSFFIGNTIANLRGLDPVFTCGRVLTLVDGRRLRQSPAPASQLPGKDQPYPPKMKEARIEVWLLKKDGTQVLPTGYSCISERGSSDAEVQYKFPTDESSQAVAAAIRVDEEFYIEKLQPLEPRQALQ